MKSSSNSILKGTIAFLSSSLIVRITAVISQFALGWFLTKEDYGIYGIALSLNGLVACFQENSILKLLIQKADYFDEWKDAGFSLSLIFTILASVLLILGAYFYGYQIGQPAILPISICVALAMAIGFPVAVYRARATSDLRFSEVAGIEATKNVFAQLMVIPLAAVGFGPMSFVLPRPFARVIEIICYRRCLPELKIGCFWRNITWSRLIKLVLDVRWLMLASLMTAIAMQGDYFVLGMLVSSGTIGVYFFGFQLVSSFSAIFSSAMNSILMPVLCSIKSDRSAQYDMYTKTYRFALALGFPLFYFAALIIGPTIHFIWKGKWDESIVVCQLLLLALPLRFLLTLVRALLEAQGRWRAASLIVGLNAVGVLAAACVGGLLGNVEGIVISVVCWQVGYSISGVIVSFIYLGISDAWGNTKTMIRFIGIYVGLLLYLHFTGFEIFHETTLSRVIFPLLFYVSVSSGLSYICCRREWLEVFSFLSNIYKRRQGGA